jgi:hypothetical protein
MEKEILILADSLAFGRPAHGICRDQTWPYRLSKELNCRLQIRAQGGATVVDILNEAKSLSFYWFGELKARKFDAALIQVGIVDCCPRLAPKPIYERARRLPGFRRLERSPLAYKMIGRPWISKSSFTNYLQQLLKILPTIAEEFFFIEIAKPAHNLVVNVGDFSERVEDYNRIIKQCAGLKSFVAWPCKNSGNSHLLPDGHHLTMIGHELVTKACSKKIQG